MSYHHHLNYFSSSPVRGQLEPEEPTPNMRTGWRFIQCTDTPNQLKVLLPPRTATFYAHLLKIEMTELIRGGEADWQRVMEIRHLKDRMIRKCQRIAQPGQQTAAADVAFRTVYAPPDFRLKEMERYLKGQEPRLKISSKAPHGSGNHSGHHHRHRAEHSPPPQPSFTPESQPSPEPHRRSTLVPPGEFTPDVFPNPHGPTDFETPTPLINDPPFPEPDPAVAFPVEEPYLERGPTPPLKEHDEYTPRELPFETPHETPINSLLEPPLNSYDENQYVDQRTFSPDPIPVPFRTSRSLDTLHEHPDEHPFLTDEGTPIPIGAEPLVQPPQRPLSRRRSSLKRQNSSSRLSASGGVAFAMDYTRTDIVAREVEMAEIELVNLRETYRAQLSEIQQGRLDIADALQRLHLQEEALRSQELRLNDTYRDLDEKEAVYRSKVMAMMEESKRVVQHKKDAALS